MSKVINIATDYTRFPAGRYKHLGSTSGQGFRERFLEEPLRAGEHLTVNFDGTIGYGSSFLEEAFGGLVRVLNVQPKYVLEHLTLVSSDQSVVDEVKEYINSAIPGG